jgi:two-component system LytT family response regulator
VRRRAGKKDLNVVKKRALIVDDEALARESLRHALSEFDDIEIAGECGDGFDAVKAINEIKPDIVFLDIQMPKLDGFDVLELLPDDPPLIVFVTAYDEYALKAFDSNALDYILKPATTDRLKKTFTKIQELVGEDSGPPMRRLLADHKKKLSPLARILVRDRSDVFIIPVEDIIYFEAQDDYVCIHTPDKALLKKETLSHLEDLLDGRIFIRIHRSYMLNIDHLRKIEPYSKDSRIAVLKNGKTLPVSRSGYARLMELL